MAENPLLVSRHNTPVWRKFALMMNTLKPYVLLLAGFLLAGWQIHDADKQVDFTAYVAGNKVKVHLTAKEVTDVEECHLERSRDKKSFTAFSSIGGKKSQVVTSEYIEVDNNPLLGWSYYRIRLKKNDGTEAMTHLVPVFYGRNRLQTGVLIAPEELGSSETVKINLGEFNGAQAVFVLRDPQGLEFFYEATISVLKDKIYLSKSEGVPSGRYAVTACSKDPLVGIEVTIE